MPPKIKVNITLKLKPKIKIKIYEKKMFNKDNYKDIEKLPVGIYRAQFDNGVSYELEFSDGFSNFKELRDNLDSDEIRRFFNDAIPMTLTMTAPLPLDALPPPNMFEDQQFLNSKSFDGTPAHCVGKDGICKALRLDAEEYRKEHSPFNTNQRTYYKRRLKKAQELEELFANEYPNGATISEIEQVCIKYKLKGSIKQPMYKLEHHFNPTLTRPLGRFRFTNIAKDHVELCYHDSELIIVESNEQLLKKYEQFKTFQGNRNLIRVSCLGKLIYAFHYADTTYCDSDYTDFMDPESPINKWRTSLKLHNIDSRSPYYPFIKSCTRVPCHVQRKIWLNADELMKQNKGNLDHSELRVITDVKLHSQDMKKAYAKFQQTAYFDGFPGQPNYMEHNPGDKWQTELGWWYIRCDERKPFLDTLTGHWTSIHLRMFHKQGIKFDVLFGIWSSIRAKVDPPPLINSKGEPSKLYVIGIGQLIQEGTRKERWYDPDNILNREYDDDDTLKLQTLKKAEWESGHLIASYIYAYAATEILELAWNTSDVYGIKVDAVISKGTYPESESWKASEPFNVDTARRTIWSDYYLNDPCKYTENHPDFPEPWDEPKHKGLEHTHFGFREFAFLIGQGGGGKSYTAAEVLRPLDPWYLAPTIKLRDEKTGNARGQFRRTLCLASLPRLKTRTLPGIIIVDEIGLCSMLEHYPEAKQDPSAYVIDWAREHGIRVIFIGDKAQLNSGYAHPNLWELPFKIHASVFEFTKDHRSVNKKTAKLKLGLRVLVIESQTKGISPSDHYRICHEIRRLVHDNIKQATQNEKQTLPSIRYYVDTESRKLSPNGEKDRWCTIDKKQGSTITQRTIILFNALSKRSSAQKNFPETVYTMVSRFTDIDDIRYVDTNTAPHY